MTAVAVLGTGIMGAPMARNLVRAGHDVRVWNRSPDKAEPLAADGATVAGSPREAAEGADVVLTMLADADAVAATMAGDDGGLAGMSPQSVWLQTSTVGVAGTERLAALAADAGVRFVDAPVLGTRQPAEQGALTVLAGGSDEVRQAVEPVLDAVGQRTLWVGDVGAGSRLKLVANSWVLAVATAVAEAMALAEGLGLSAELFLEAIAGGPLDLPYARLKGGAILDRSFPPAFPVAGAAKDAALVGEAAQQAGVRMLVAEAVRQQMTSARDAGHGDEDMAAVWYAVRGEAES